MTEEYLLEENIHSRVGALIREFISFRNKLHLGKIHDKLDARKNDRSCLKLMFHNKGIEMIEPPYSSKFSWHNIFVIFVINPLSRNFFHEN